MLLCTITFRRGAGIILVLLLVLSAPRVAQATAFLADVDDLPLAPGLIEDAGSRMAFDKPGGRIVQALASGPVAPAAVRTFYTETLPELGWQLGPSGSWTRGSEMLSVSFESASGGVVVRFAIAPAGTR